VTYSSSTCGIIEIPLEILAVNFVEQSENLFDTASKKSVSLGFENPFMVSGFPYRSATNTEHQGKESSQVTNTILFEVVVMLLEIVHGKSFDRLMREKEKAGASGGDLADRLMWRERAAWRLFKVFPAYMCLRSYKEVTERCLKNQFSDEMERALFDNSSGWPHIRRLPSLY
jgi:hypothetical protein